MPIQTDRLSSLFPSDHASRYHQAARHVRGRIVLDISPVAPAESARLLLDAGALVAIRLSDPERRRNEVSAWRALEPSYLRDAPILYGRPADPPLGPGSVDVVVWMFPFQSQIPPADLTETICRLLTPGGLLVTSVANADWTDLPLGGWGVPLSPAQLRETLVRSFGGVQILGQSPRQTMHGRALPRRDSRLDVIRDPMTRLIHNRGWKPGEYDFRFTSETQGAPFLFATATRQD